MSEAAARKVLRDAIDSTFKEYTRGILDSRIHVIDISYDSLLKANKQRDTSKYTDDYAEFLWTAYSLANKVEDYLAAVKLVTSGRGTCILQEGPATLLISKNFDTARDFITKISNLIPTNDSFGLAYRTRDLQEVQVSRKLARAAGSYFLVKDVNSGKFVIQAVQKEGNKYGLVTIPNLEVKKVLHFAKRTSTEYSVSTNLDRFNNLEVEFIGNDIAIKKRLLSVLDLGHGQGELSAQITPAGQKISNLLKLGLSPVAKAVVESALSELRDLHNIVSFEFKNTSTDSQASGYVVLSIQNYKRNNVLSVSEGRLLANLQKKLGELLPNIPGSNTIKEDKLEAFKNKFISILTGKPPKKIKPHASTVKGKVTPQITVTSPNTTSVSVKRKIVTFPTPKLRNLGGQFYSLASLQNLINSNLAQKIRENMGDGTRKDILNLRTGRFAESAKVERMSQSREGMVTAFYTYMRNPYGTFSEGGAQGIPKSRDPKLLISKSIHQIAATHVANRMRAVLS